MKLNKLIGLTLILIACQACKPEYQRTIATITDLKIEGDKFNASLEYVVDSVRYTDQFSITIDQMTTDSISTPHPGITFEILYNPENPKQNVIEFRVKPEYLEIRNMNF
jgi:polyisoprenoid-binding protein YceI